MWKIILVLGVLTQLSFGVEITKTTAPEVTVSKSPVWSDDAHSLYYVNFFPVGNESSLFRYSAKDKSFHGAYIEGNNMPSFIVPLSKRCEDLFAVGIGHDIMKVHWDGESDKATIVDKILTVEPEDQMSRLDIAKADPTGRLYFGTFSLSLCGNKTASRASYTYSEKDGVKKILSETFSTSGIAFNEDIKKAYIMDTCTAIIKEFDWNEKTGDIANGRLVIDLSKNGDYDPLYPPLGMDIDKKGNIYVGIYSGSIKVIDPRKSKIIDTIDLQAKGLTGAAFGGKSRKTLYVVAGTVLSNVQTASILGQAPHGTSVYAVNGLSSAGRKSTHLKYKNCPKTNIFEKVLEKLKF